MVEYRLEHFGITVADLDRAVDWYKYNLGFREIRRADKPDLTLKLAKLEVKGLVEIELIEPYREPLETPLHRIGSYHLGLSVKNVAEAYERLKDSVVFIQELLNRGVYFGMHPRAYLMELIQRKEPPFQLGNWCP